MPKHGWYFATFVSGCQEIIAQRLRKFPNSALRAMELQDGLVLFESSLTADQISELRFFNNVYHLLADSASQKELSIPDMPKQGSFIVVAREGSQPVTPPDGLTARIASQTGLELSAHKPNYTFFHWRRSDGRVLLGLALPRAGFKQRKVESGELRPELAHILGLVASLDAKHKVLDPFAGYGGIARECLQGFHAKEVIAVESNQHLIPHLKSIPHLVALHGDARRLAHIYSSSIDRVITDPPWGEFAHQPDSELVNLYRGALVQMHRVLRTKGVAVIITAAAFLPSLAPDCGFAIEQQYNVLVSGHKAVIYKLRKHNYLAA